MHIKNIMFEPLRKHHYFSMPWKAVYCNHKKNQHYVLFVNRNCVSGCMQLMITIPTSKRFRIACQSSYLTQRPSRRSSSVSPSANANWIFRELELCQSVTPDQNLFKPIRTSWYILYLERTYSQNINLNTIGPFLLHGFRLFPDLISPSAFSQWSISCMGNCPRAHKVIIDLA